MKPIITWVLWANARTASVFEHKGPGKGLTPLKDQIWHAPDVDLPRDKAGVGHSIAGPGIRAVERSNPQELADAHFAKDVMGHLARARTAKRFERLILIAGPHMLGLLRKHLDAPLRASLLGEIPKDLTAQPISVVENHLGDLIAI